MTKQSRQNVVSDPITTLLQNNFLFAPLGQAELESCLQDHPIVREKLYSNRPIYTAFRPDNWLDYLYIILDGGPVIMRSTPLDRVIGITYPGGALATPVCQWALVRRREPFLAWWRPIKPPMW